MISYERPDGRLLVREAADAHGVSIETINELIRRDQLDVVWSPWYNGRARWVDEQRVDVLLSERGHPRLPEGERREREVWTHPDGLSVSEVAELLRTSRKTARERLNEAGASYFEATTRGGTAKFYPVEEIERVFGPLG